MAENTKIQWTNHTVNFWTGCKKVSPGCKFCYMYRDQERYGREPEDLLQVKQATINRILNKAEAGDKVFTCSWSDFFIEGADKWRAWAWDIIRSRPDLHWQILTKRPERILECLPEDWGEGWANVWLGVSVENQKICQERISYLCGIPAKVRFLSVEPILGPVDIYPWNKLTIESRSGKAGSAIDWVIIGGESGNDNGKYRYRPSEIKWYSDLVKQCQESGVPVFVKQLGTYLSKNLSLSDRHGGKVEDFPKEIQVREFPKNIN